MRPLRFNTLLILLLAVVPVFLILNHVLPGRSKPIRHHAKRPRREVSSTSLPVCRNGVAVFVMPGETDYSGLYASYEHRAQMRNKCLRVYTLCSYTEKECQHGSSNRNYLVRSALSYPPKDFVLHFWKTLARDPNTLKTYRWFLKIDSDAYLNVDVLLDTLFTLDYTKPQYFGGWGRGRAGVQGKLEFMYCLGMGYVMSKPTIVQTFGTSNVQAGTFPNSDISVAWAIFEKLSVTCNDAVPSYVPYLFVNNYYTVHNGVLETRRLSSMGQTYMKMFQAPTTHLFRSILVHSIKTQAEMANFNEQVLHPMRPGMPYKISASFDPNDEGAVQIARGYVTHYQTKVRGSCVFNYASQIENFHYTLKTCQMDAQTHKRKLWDHSVMITLYYDRAQKRIQKMNLFFNIDIFMATDMRHSPEKDMLTGGEQGYRETMFDVLTHLVLSGSDDTAWLVMDDDARRIQNFTEYYSEIQEDMYCRQALDFGGVLMLSASIWYKGSYPSLNSATEYVGGWALADHDKKVHKSMCASGQKAFVGSVAVVYTRKAAALILDWLDDTPNKPFDHVFGHLAQKGVAVRMVTPHLFIAPLDKISSTNPQRSISTDTATAYQIHRWNPELYV